MSIFSGGDWVPHFSDLEVGKRYQIGYGVVCLNGVQATEVARQLRTRGIAMLPSAGILNGVTNTAQDEFTVLRPMTQADFSDSFRAAFDSASRDALVSCFGVSVRAFEVWVPSGSVGSAFTGGVTAGLVLTTFAVAGIVWLAVKK